MKLTKEQADKLAEACGGERIFFLKTECFICGAESGAILAERNIRFYMTHVKAIVACKTCAEELQRAVVTFDMPYVVLQREDEEDERGHPIT